MKISATNWYIILYFVLFFAHFALWKFLNVGFEVVFIRYYIFLTLLFVLAVTALTIIRKNFPQYIGFGFLGLVMVKMMALFIVMNQLDLSSVPNYKMHFAIPYLVSLVLETLYAVKLIQIEDKVRTEKDEKNQ